MDDSSSNVSGIRLGGSTDPRALRTRKAIREAFLALLGQNSFDEITPQQIAKSAGVARASFYLHYPSKLSLLEEVAHEAIADVFDMGTQALETGGSEAAARTNCEQIQKNWKLWKTLLNGGAQGIIREELRRRGKIVADERSMPGDRLPVELGYMFSSAVMMEIISWWLRQEDHYPPEFVANLMVQLVFDPIRAVSISPNLKFS